MLRREEEKEGFREEWEVQFSGHKCLLLKRVKARFGGVILQVMRSLGVQIS